LVDSFEPVLLGRARRALSTRPEHTRGGILRGGSYYQPLGSVWYFPQAYRNDQHGKLLMMAPSYDRSGALGFRCVQDAE